VDAERERSIRQFLYREARLLDNRRYREWLNLMTDDIEYIMPTRFNRLRDGPNDEWEIEKELADLKLFDEDKTSLEDRIDRLYSGMAWAEDPPSRTRHLITNIEYEDGDNPNEARVYSNFLAYRNRLQGLDGDEDFFLGQREDILRQVEGEWRLAKRRVILDVVLIKAQNVSIFF
jgi:3-phenylpropionate/cinnamic acid dioxygenase small subunit